MPLEQILIAKIESLGPITWKKMFGMQTVLISGKLLGGYKAIDESVIYAMLILSPKKYQEAVEEGYFSKFDFGKTWVECEITTEEDLENVWLYFKDAYNFAKERKK
jgi:hypothetical protein